MEVEPPSVACMSLLHPRRVFGGTNWTRFRDCSKYVCKQLPVFICCGLHCVSDRVGGRSWRGRWSLASLLFLRAPESRRTPVQWLWLWRWAGIHVCSAACGFASLLDSRALGGADGDVPSVHEVLGDERTAA